MTKQSIDPIALYHGQVAESNRRMTAALATLVSHETFTSALTYEGIRLWEVLLGTYAPQIIFPDLISEEENFKNKPRSSSPSGSLRRYRRLFRILTRFLWGACRHPRGLKSKTDVKKVICLAFECRQSAFLRPASRPETARAITPLLITSLFSGSDPHADFQSSDCEIISIENSLSWRGLAKLFSAQIRLKLDLQPLMSSVPSKSDEHQLIKLLVRDAPKALAYVLFARHLLRENHNPLSVVGANNSDLRARAFFLAAQQMDISTFHMQYGYFAPNCWEEKYLVTTAKLVFSQLQKKDILSCFDLDPDQIIVVGRSQPRLPGTRLKLPHARMQDWGFLFGSQPSRIPDSGYNLLTAVTKMAHLELFASTYASSDYASNPVFWKSHPDENTTEAATAIELLQRKGIKVRIVNTINDEVMGNVLAHVTYFSTLSLDCFGFGVPTLFLLPIEKEPLLLRATQCGIACVFDPDRFNQDVKRILGHEDEIPRFLNREVGSSDTEAVSRIWNILTDTANTARMI